MTFETLRCSRADGVARIVLNRPEVRNALSRTLIDELAVALAAKLAAFSPTAIGLMKEAAATTRDMEDTKALRPQWKGR